MATDKRPMSPHLQIYRLPLIVIMSIMHRITGVVLTLGIAILVYWLLAIAAGDAAYAHAQRVLGSMLGQLVLFLWTWALYYHLCNGIRHLVWDAGYGFEVTTADQSGKITLIASIVLTFLTWLIAAP